MYDILGILSPNFYLALENFQNSCLGFYCFMALFRNLNEEVISPFKDASLKAVKVSRSFTFL